MLEVRDALEVVRRAEGRRPGVARRAARARSSGLIGPNGAGKTTLFAAIAGFHAPDAGRVTFRTRTSPAWRRTGSAPPAWCAPSRSPSRSRKISVRENIMVGAYFRTADRRRPRGRPRRWRPWSA